MKSSLLAALLHELPTKPVRLVRFLWFDIQAALERGHTLRTIHERLQKDGVSISYRHLSACVCRLRRGQIQPISVTAAATERVHDSAPVPESKKEHDPLANVRERLIRNRPGFNYDDSPPDRDKLIGR